MRRLASLLIILSVWSVVRAEYCRPISPIQLYSDNELDLRIFLDDAPAAGATVSVYAGEKMVRSAVADQSGEVRWILLPGKYRVVIDQKGVLDVVVDAKRSNLNGPYIYWYLFPKLTEKWVEGKKVVSNRCPIVGEKAD